MQKVKESSSVALAMLKGKQSVVDVLKTTILDALNNFLFDKFVDQCMEHKLALLWLFARLPRWVSVECQILESLPERRRFVFLEAQVPG